MPRPVRYDSNALDLLIRQQRGVIGRDQLLELGIGSSSISHRIRPGGSWQRLLPGVYLTHRGPISTQDRRAAALQHAGPAALLTGAAALLLHGMRNAPGSQLMHVLVPHEQQVCSTDFLVVERTQRLPVPVKVAGYPCAPIARAALDASRRTRDQDVVRAVLAEVVQRRRCTPADLADELANGPTRGSALPRRVLAEVSAGARSVAEAQLHRRWGQTRLPMPAWNQDLYDDDGCWVACVDGWWKEHGVGLELDSREWHLDPAGWQKTMDRHMRLTARGALMLHVSPNRVARHWDAFVAEVAGALSNAPGGERVRLYPGLPPTF